MTEPNQTITPEVAAQTALQAVRAGQFEQAEALCAALLQAAPGHPDGLHALGALRLKQQRFAEAAQLMEGAVAWLEQHAPRPQRDPLMAAWLADWGLALNGAGRLPEALEKWQSSAQLQTIPQVQRWIAEAQSVLQPSFKQAQAASSKGRVKAVPKQQKKAAAPKEMQKWLDQAIAAYQAGDWGQCLESAQRILSKAPQFSEAHHLQAAVYRQRKEWDNAHAAIARATRAAPHIAAYWNTAGLIAADTGDHRQAEAHYREALRLDPKMVNAWNHLGITLRELGQADEAERCYRQALAIDPASPLAYLNLTGLLHKQQRYEEALQLLKQGLNVAPEHPDLWCNRGVILAEMKDGIGAEMAYRKALALKPGDAVIWMNLGNVLDDQDRLAEALEAKRQAITLKPDLANGWLNYGNLLKRLGQDQEAAAAYQRAIQLDDRLAQAYNNLANLYRGFGHATQAIVLYRKALELNPDFSEAYCGLGATYQEAGHLDEAAGYFQQALSRQQDMTDVIFNLAMLRADQGRFAEALELAQSGQALRPNDTNGWLARASIAKQQGQIQEAINASRKAIDLEWQWLRSQNTALFTDSTKPPMKVDDAGSVLLELKQFLDAKGIPFFLAYGTLLGIYRDGDLLPFDKDMDLGIPWDVPRQWLIDQIQASDAFEVKGLADLDEATMAWNIAILHKEKNIVTDFFFFKPDGSSVLSGFHHRPSPLLWRFSAFETAPMLYRGVPMPAPADPEKYLVEIYGKEWRIPDPYFDSVVSGFNLVPECRDISIAFAHLRLLEHLKNRNWKKAYGYCKQLFAYQDDPWLRELSGWLQAQMPSPQSGN